MSDLILPPELPLEKKVYDFIELVEGFKSNIHNDSKNIPTIGRGLALIGYNGKKKTFNNLQDEKLSEVNSFHYSYFGKLRKFILSDRKIECSKRDRSIWLRDLIELKK